MAVIMTNEEAIKELQKTYNMIRSYAIDESKSRLMIALNMAVKALEQESHNQTKADVLTDINNKYRDTLDMVIKALEQEPTKEEKALLQKWRDNRGISMEEFEEAMDELQEPKIGHCKNCKYFEYDSVAKVDGIPLIVAHEICSRWGDGCKTKEDGFCFLFEPKEDYRVNPELDRIKTELEQEQKTGQWILADEQNKEDVENDNYRFICSECQCSDIHAKGAIVPYCWKCGAKMEG